MVRWTPSAFSPAEIQKRDLAGSNKTTIEGQPFLKASRRANDEHQIEKVGAKLRAMMPWIAKGKMVDRSRN